MQEISMPPHRVYNQLTNLHSELTDTFSFGPFVDYVLKALSAKDKEPYKKGFKSVEVFGFVAYC